MCAARLCYYRSIIRPHSSTTVTHGLALSVVVMSPEKMAEPIQMPSGTWAWLAPGSMYYMEVQILTREGAILMEKSGHVWGS